VAVARVVTAVANVVVIVARTVDARPVLVVRTRMAVPANVAAARIVPAVVQNAVLVVRAVDARTVPVVVLQRRLRRLLRRSKRDASV